MNLRGEFIKCTLRRLWGTTSTDRDYIYLRPEVIDSILVQDGVTKLYLVPGTECFNAQADNFESKRRHLVIEETPDQLFMQDHNEKFQSKMDEVLK